MARGNKQTHQKAKRYSKTIKKLGGKNGKKSKKKQTLQDEQRRDKTIREKLQDSYEKFKNI